MRVRLALFILLAVGAATGLGWATHWGYGILLGCTALAAAVLLYDDEKGGDGEAR